MTGTGRWQRLAAARAWPLRPLWASTGVKNPAYHDTLYPDGPVATDTVSTMPTLDRLHRVRAKGDISQRLRRPSRRVLRQPAAAGGKPG